MRINMPSCYIAENNALDKIIKYCSHIMQQNVLIVVDQYADEYFRETLENQMSRGGIIYKIEVLKGECCMQTINTLLDTAKAIDAECVVAVGGGKVIDTVKAVGYFAKMHTVIIPTVATTDGACSKISVLYDEEGRFKEYLYLEQNPEYVIVDLNIIAQAPVRFLKAGIGDALSTYFETESGYRKQQKELGQSEISNTARALSKACLDTLLTEGREAIISCEAKQVSLALKHVVEAIIYMSCGGFENGALGMAHDICNLLSTDKTYNYLMHGEKVAYGVNLQLQLEEYNLVTVSQVREFCKSIGLPVTGKDIELKEDMQCKVIQMLEEKYQISPVIK